MPALGLAGVDASYAQVLDDTKKLVKTCVQNEVSLFWHKMAGTYNKAHELQFELQLGSKKWPEYPVVLQAEAFYQLRKTMGVLGSAYTSLDFSGKEYIDNKFIIGFEKDLLMRIIYGVDGPCDLTYY